MSSVAGYSDAVGSYRYATKAQGVHLDSNQEKKGLIRIFKLEGEKTRFCC
jgi:hypothetical protein